MSVALHRAGGAALIGALALMLAGCPAGVNMARGPIAITGTGEDFHVAVCDDVVAEELAVEFREQARAGDWVELWDATGSVNVASGETFELASLRDRFDDVDAHAVPVQAGSAVGVFVSTPDGQVAAVFELPAESYDPDLWYRPARTGYAVAFSTPCE